MGKRKRNADDYGKKQSLFGNCFVTQNIEGLKNAESFIYRNTIVNSEKITNISFDGDLKYEFKE